MTSSEMTRLGSGGGTPSTRNLEPGGPSNPISSPRRSSIGKRTRSLPDTATLRYVPQWRGYSCRWTHASLLRSYT